MQKKVLFKGQDLSYLHLVPARRQTDTHPPLTLMLVHGFPERGSIFEKQIAALSEDFTLLIPDLPGSGNSAYNSALMSTADFADGLAAVIRAEQIDKLTVIGHSMGGYIALAYGEKYPQHIQGLGLLHSTAYQDNEEKKANRIKAIQTMERHGGATFLRSLIPALFGAAFKKAHPEMIQQMIQAGQHFDTRALQQYYQIMHDRTDKTSLLTSLPIPFLLISGTEDKAAPAEDLIRQSSLPATAMINILEDSGHMGFLEKADQVNDIIRRFMELVHNLPPGE